MSHLDPSTIIVEQPTKNLRSKVAIGIAVTLLAGYLISFQYSSTNTESPGNNRWSEAVILWNEHQALAIDQAIWDKKIRARRRNNYL